MRILVVSQYYWPETFRITDICEGLVERGHQVDVLTSIPNVPQGKFYEGYSYFKRGEKEHNGVQIDRVGVFERSKSDKIMWTLNCLSFAIHSLFHLPKHFKKQYDAVFVFNNSPVTVIFPAKVFAFFKRVPVLVYILDIWPESLYSLVEADHIDYQSWFYRLSAAFCRWLYRTGDTLLLSSRGFTEKLHSMGLKQRMVFFPNYAEELKEDSSFSVTRSEFSFSDEDFVIGFAGGMGPAQGIDLVMEACEKLSDLPYVKFLMMGDGTEFAKLKQAVQEKHLEDRFVLTGWISSAVLPNYMELCDVMMMSLKDNDVLNITVPAKLQTYMKAAKPVLAFMNGAGAQEVLDAGCGFAAKANDVDNLVEVIRSIVSCDSDELISMGQNGKAYCERVYNRENVLDLLESELNLVQK